MIALIVLLSCGGPQAESEPETVHSSEEAYRLQALDAPRLLRRLSLDLRGVLPTARALDAVERNPDKLTDFTDRYLDDPRLEDRLVSLYAERWQTRLDDFEVDHWEYGFDDVDEFVYEQSIGEEPLRLMARIAVDDRPWTEVVTSPTTMANEITARIWPIDRPAGQGWQESRYTDGRPAAGVLATNGMWWRYVTTQSNMNRGRVAALVKLLACQDLLARPVELSGSVSLADEDASAEAIRTEPACQSCHATVEPIAASLFGSGQSSTTTRSKMGTTTASVRTWGRCTSGSSRPTLGSQWMGSPGSGWRSRTILASTPVLSRLTLSSCCGARQDPRMSTGSRPCGRPS
jgi:hypothetical protein